MSINTIWNSIATLLNALLSQVFVFLPPSPFKEHIVTFSENETVQYINWFIPVGQMITVTVAWLSAIAVFYAYQVILRWIKAVDD